MVGENPAGALQRAPDGLGEILGRTVGRDGAGLEAGHVEEVGDEAVEALGLGEEGAEELDAVRFAEVLGEVAERAGRADDRRERRAEVVRHRRQQRASQLLGLHA
jgi:hypothetical protein